MLHRTSSSPRLASPCLIAPGPYPRLLFLVVVREVVVVVIVFLAFPASPPRLPSPSFPTLCYLDSLSLPPRSSTVMTITVVSVEAKGGRRRAAPLPTSLLLLQPPFL
ncbi:uncharacterized protein LOC130948088 [Arachis stenosperma]|uniref:uncharacterized protein LOC130948088 n=1 Tax=Arachis stenosperma TaxID=217475 RepID=UPI0025AB6DBE|nr:uncharacterized protein LOC130948088 [Arachis stenosperma]